MQTSDDLLADVLREMGERIGQDCLPGASGVVTFSTGRVAVSIETRPADPNAYFHAPVGRLSELPADVSAEALAWNLFNQPLPGSWLAIDRETGELVLCHATAKAGLTARAILAILDGLAATAEDLAVTLGRPARIPDGTGEAVGGDDVSLALIRV